MEENPNVDSKCIGKLCSKKDKGSSGRKRRAHEILITAVNFYFQLWGIPTVKILNIGTCMSEQTV